MLVRQIKITTNINNNRGASFKKQNRVPNSPSSYISLFSRVGFRGSPRLRTLAYLTQKTCNFQKLYFHWTLITCSCIVFRRLGALFFVHSFILLQTNHVRLCKQCSSPHLTSCSPISDRIEGLLKIFIFTMSPNLC